MNIKNLQTKYKNMRLSEKPLPTDNGELALYSHPFYIYIPKAAISDDEAVLLKLLFEPAPVTFSDKAANNWYTRLFSPTRQPNDEIPNGSYRFTQIQLQADTLSASLKKEWKAALYSFFSSHAVFLPISPDYHIVIEKMEDSLLGEEELEAVASTLENDFYAKTYFFSGLFYQSGPEIQRLFAEEQKLFLEYPFTHAVQTVSSASLRVISKNLADTSIFQEIARFLKKEPDNIKLIERLFHNQGNISLSAKDLFLHRNTIQYRIDKFYEQTNLSLRKMDDLLFVYLCSLDQVE
ncbi:helix-turn-helix domain-containing protein [Listeria grayi]|uniref:PucR C-terminal helix-turn-helix domain-containing protein n=1 Tax=Listeria grayi DSM 20601 TaxID=525367 RepID=D7UV75_LISGR|nr:helix-turn-helix domain-containing protein [Listeria grayi]EFI85151.1 hypothetical protein HMPREF0556_10350 [Listeria grayi DSM 20601]